jgi:hypothetical protein
MPTLNGAKKDMDAPNPIMVAAYDKDCAKVGKAFKEVLFKGVPSGLDGLVNKLTDLGIRDKKLLPAKILEIAREEPDVKIAQPESERLIPYGITPLILFETTDAIGELIERAQRRNLLPIDQAIYLSYQEGATYQNQKIATSLIIDHILEFTCLAGIKRSRDIVATLLSWSIDAARYKPYLITEFKAEPGLDGDGIYLHRNEEVLQIYDRWSRTK